VYNVEHIIPQETMSFFLYFHNFFLYFHKNIPLFLLYFQETIPIIPIIFSNYPLGALMLILIVPCWLSLIAKASNPPMAKWHKSTHLVLNTITNQSINVYFSIAGAC